MNILVLQISNSFALFGIFRFFLPLFLSPSLLLPFQTKQNKLLKQKQNELTKQKQNKNKTKTKTKQKQNKNKTKTKQQNKTKQETCAVVGVDTAIRTKSPDVNFIFHLPATPILVPLATGNGLVKIGPGLSLVVCCCFFVSLCFFFFFLLNLFPPTTNNYL